MFELLKRIARAMRSRTVHVFGLATVFVVWDGGVKELIGAVIAALMLEMILRKRNK